MELKTLAAEDRLIFDEFLALKPHVLSAYAFENIYIWKALFSISWGIINGSLCVFFSDNIGTFMYLPPLAAEIKPAVIDAAFEIMARRNTAPGVSRIENIEESDSVFYRNHGFACSRKFGDYLCLRQDLAALKGNQFKSKRAAVNYFEKHSSASYQPYTAEDKQDCLELYRYWMRSRSLGNQDTVYQGMLGDSLKSLMVLLEEYPLFKMTGRLVMIDSKVKAFTFGFKLSDDTFCVAYEVSDLSVKGLSQFIFRRFSEELKEYRYINIMDDSGLENLKKVKESYHPLRVIPNYIARKP
ncbi:MAG: phosphatidylglycerol lysyltransferase domain-containing protein [Candidatus Omnitrophota bacterium]|jgi:hypothetical protein